MISVIPGYFSFSLISSNLLIIPALSPCENRESPPPFPGEGKALSKTKEAEPLATKFCRAAARQPPAPQMPSWNLPQANAIMHGSSMIAISTQYYSYSKVFCG